MHISYPITTPITLAKLQGPYEAAIRDYKTWRRICRDLDLLIEFFQHKDPQDVTRAEIKTWLAWLEEKRGQSHWQVDQCRRSAGGFFLWMMHMEVPGVVTNPCWSFPEWPSNGTTRPRIQ